jgi:flagellar biosynthesis repressor protein FlbT
VRPGSACAKLARRDSQLCGPTRKKRETDLPLKLSLRPGEKFVLNGAVLQNGDRRAVLVLQNKASVLREKDIMQEAEVETPARRIYFPVMMMYLDEAAAQRYYDEFVLRLSEFMGVIQNPPILAHCVNISRHCMEQEYYKALMLCRKLIEYEDERLGHDPTGLPAGGDAG